MRNLKTWAVTALTLAAALLLSISEASATGQVWSEEAALLAVYEHLDDGRPDKARKNIEMRNIVEATAAEFAITGNGFLARVTTRITGLAAQEPTTHRRATTGNREREYWNITDLAALNDTCGVDDRKHRGPSRQPRWHTPIDRRVPAQCQRYEKRAVRHAHRDMHRIRRDADRTTTPVGVRMPPG